MDLRSRTARRGTSTKKVTSPPKSTLRQERQKRRDRRAETTEITTSATPSRRKEHTASPAASPKPKRRTKIATSRASPAASPKPKSPPRRTRSASASAAPSTNPKTKSPSRRSGASGAAGAASGAARDASASTDEEDPDAEYTREYEKQRELKMKGMSDVLDKEDEKWGKAPIVPKEALRRVLLSSRASGILFLNVSARVLSIIHESNEGDVDGQPYPIVDGRVLRHGPVDVDQPRTDFDNFCRVVRKLLSASAVRNLSLCAVGRTKVILEDYVLTKVGGKPTLELPLGQNLVLALTRNRPESTKFSDGDELFQFKGLEIAGFISYRPHTDLPGKLFKMGEPPRPIAKLYKRLLFAMNATTLNAHNRGPYPYNRVLDLDVVCTSVGRPTHEFTNRSGANVLGNMLLYTLLKEFNKVGEDGDYQYLAVYVKLVLYSQSHGARVYKSNSKEDLNPLYPILLQMGFVDCTAMMEKPLTVLEAQYDLMVLMSNEANKPLGRDSVVMNRLIAVLQEKMAVRVGDDDDDVIPFSDICPDNKVCR